jgi:hypothetical protein
METQTLDNPTAIPPAIIPDLKVIDATAGTLIKEAGEIKPIASREGYTALDVLVGKLAAARKDVRIYIETFFSKHIANAHKAHKDLCDDRSKYLEQHDRPLAEAAAKAVALMRAFEKEEADRQKKLQEEAEAKRKADEKAAADKAEKDRQDQLQKDEEQRLARAADLEANGQAAEAERVLNAPPPPPPPPPPPLPPVQAYHPTQNPLKASNAGTRKNWTWKPKADPRACLAELVKAAAENPDAFLDFLTFNADALKAKAKALEAQARVPGIEFYNDPINSNRARA